jgi:hypothetical protein
MLIKKAGEIPSSEITSQSVYLNRRKFLTGAAVAGVAAAAGLRDLILPKMAEAANKIDGIRKSSFSTNEKINEYKDVTAYRQAAAKYLEYRRSKRVRLLCQCESQRGSPALEPGQRAPSRRIFQTPDADLQRLWRSGGQFV